MSGGAYISWSNWKAGLFVSILTGLFTGLGAYEISDHIKWQRFAIFLLACISKDALLFLKSTPLRHGPPGPPPGPPPEFQLPLKLLALGATISFYG